MGKDFQLMTRDDSFNPSPLGEVFPWMPLQRAINSEDVRLHAGRCPAVQRTSPGGCGLNECYNTPPPRDFERRSHCGVDRADRGVPNLPMPQGRSPETAPVSEPIDVNAARQFALSVVRKLREDGHQAYWAGGCVRDHLRGERPKDYDVATDARPNEIREVFGRRRTRFIGAAFGVVSVSDRVEPATSKWRPSAATRDTATEDTPTAWPTARPKKMPGDATSRSTVCSSIR